MPTKLEHQPIVSELIVRRSKLVLFLKGAWTWAIFIMLFMIIDQFFYAVPQADRVLVALRNNNALTLSAFIVMVLIFLYGALMLYIVLFWLNEFYVLKDNSVSIHWGIIARKEQEYDTEEIDSINIRQGWIGRLFDIGSVVLSSPKLPEQIILRNIPNPKDVAETVHQFSFRYRKLVHGAAQQP